MDWIDAKNILPEESGYYLTCHKIEGTNVFISSTLGFNSAVGRFNDPDGSGDYAIPVDYWMFLPEPPEVGTVMH